MGNDMKTKPNESAEQFLARRKRRRDCRAAFWIAALAWLMTGLTMNFELGKNPMWMKVLLIALYMLMGMGTLWAYGTARIERHIGRKMGTFEGDADDDATPPAAQEQTK